MFGLALPRYEIPDQLITRHQLQDRICLRRDGAEEEVQFLSARRPRLLPVWINGQLLIVPWGRNDLWCPVEALEAGAWGHLHPVPVAIPARFACDRGVWYLVREGFQGVVVQISKLQIVYPLTKPANHYHQVMTRSGRMVVTVEGG